MSQASAGVVARFGLFKLILHRQTRHAVEVMDIPRDHGEVLGKRDSGDTRVRLADGDTGPFELCTNPTVCFRSDSIEGQTRYVTRALIRPLVSSSVNDPRAVGW